MRLYEQLTSRFEYFVTDKGIVLGGQLKAVYAWEERYGWSVGRDRRAHA
jgi:DNA-binding HxlR family transcriptional regulator